MAHQEELHDDDFNEDDSHSDSAEQDSSAKEAASDEDLEYGSQEAREALRASMAADVEAFLARGGRIREVEPDVMADPPRKPQTNYGSRPI